MCRRFTTTLIFSQIAFPFQSVDNCDILKLKKCKSILCLHRASSNLPCLLHIVNLLYFPEFCTEVEVKITSSPCNRSFIFCRILSHKQKRCQGCSFYHYNTKPNKVIWVNIDPQTFTQFEWLKTHTVYINLRKCWKAYINICRSEVGELLFSVKIVKKTKVNRVCSSGSRNDPATTFKTLFK